MKNKKEIYLAGDLLMKGNAMLRDWEKEQLENAGINVYNPKDDKSINDKQEQTIESNNTMAERVVANDNKAIKKATTVVADVLESSIGTICELNLIQGYNEYRKNVADIIYNNDDSQEKIKKIKDLIENVIPHKDVYVQSTDIRRHNIPEVGDRRSHRINQYLYGIILLLTNSKGIMEWEDIVEELKKGEC